ncbi:MAG: ATP-binding protein [Bryobacteraceae bacterium]|jgi:PAS domain S-box-containing protein
MVSDPQNDSPGLFARWSRVSLRAKGVAALSVPMAALFAALFSIYWVENQNREADLVAVRAYDTRADLLQLQVFLLDADVAMSRYLASPEGRFLTAFVTARTNVEQSLARLASQVGDDPASAAMLVRIRTAAEDCIRTLGQFRDAGAADRAPLLEKAGGFRREAQARLETMDQAQDLRLFRASYNREVARRQLFRVVVVCGIIGPLGALFVHLIMAGRLVRRIRAVGENARRLALALPLEPFPRGTDEIAELARQLEYAAGLLQARERDLRASERRYRELFDQAPVAYEETDTEGVVHRFNQAVCALLKRSPDQVLGCMAWDFVDPESQSGFREAMMERIASDSETGPFECEYVLDDGSRITVEIRENLIRDERGAVTGACRSLMDVTERNLAAIAASKVAQYAMELRNKNEQLASALEAARAATEAKGRFLAGVSHELRTPLNAIIGFSEMLHDGRLGAASEEQRECLGDILRSARHLLALINDTLDLAKVEAGKMRFRPEPCSLQALVREVCDVIHPLADKKSIRVASEVPGDLTAVIDPSRFKQVLYNYLSNAVKFTPNKGQVMVRVAREGDSMFRLEVEDTGIGIAPEDIPQLFQEFQQLRSSRGGEQGTGLGLALTRRVVEAQGGQVGVRSVPGRGSVFAAVLPLALAG